MRSFRLLMLAVLALMVALPLAPRVYAGQVGFGKLCIPNSSGVMFPFEMTDPSGTSTMDFGCDSGYAFVGGPSGTYVFTELVAENPPGWVLTDISCERISGGGQTSWRTEGASATVNYDGSDDVVACYFTNTGPSPPPSASVIHYVEEPWSICAIQLGVQEQNGTIAWLPGYAYPGTPISLCRNKTNVLGADVLGETLMFHQFIMNGTSFEIVTTVT
jgi:hypothetical protein